MNVHVVAPPDRNSSRRHCWTDTDRGKDTQTPFCLARHNPTGA